MAVTIGEEVVGKTNSKEESNKVTSIILKK